MSETIHNTTRAVVEATTTDIILDGSGEVIKIDEDSVCTSKCYAIPADEHFEMEVKKHG